VQVAHDGDRQQDAQPTVVLAAIAHRVVMRIIGLCAGNVGEVAANHIADGVDVRIHAGLAHPFGSWAAVLRCAGVR
jgi:hypothetical protein